MRVLTHICLRPSFDDVTQINFRFRLLVTWSSPRRRRASPHIIWCKVSLSSPKLLTFFRNSRWRPPPFWIFSLCEFGHSGVRVGSVVFVFCTKFGSNTCYSHWDRHTYASNIYLITSHELTSGFDFWSRRRGASSHKIIQSKVIDIFPKFKMAAVDFQFMWIWPFRCVDSVVFVFCTKFGSNICYSHWDRHTYASNIHLMTSRELTSGFDFWLPSHLRVAFVHLPI